MCWLRGTSCFVSLSIGYIIHNIITFFLPFPFGGEKRGEEARGRVCVYIREEVAQSYVIRDWGYIKWGKKKDSALRIR